MFSVGYLPKANKMHNQHDERVFVMDIYIEHDNYSEMQVLFFTNHNHGIGMIFVLIPQSCGGGQWVEHNNELRMEWLKIENEQKMMEDNKDSNISDGSLSP